MIVFVNKEQKLIQENTNLDSLIKNLKIDTQSIAIAVNDSIVTRDTWTEIVLRENDRILIITATQGG